MTLPSTLHQPLAPRAQALMAAFRFVLVAPSHAGNIGSVVRAMRTMGLADLSSILWRERAADVSGRSAPCGHYIAEESPALLLQEALSFFRS